MECTAYHKADKREPWVCRNGCGIHHPGKACPVVELGQRMWAAAEQFRPAQVRKNMNMIYHFNETNTEHSVISLQMLCPYALPPIPPLLTTAVFRLLHVDVIVVVVVVRIRPHLVALASALCPRPPMETIPRLETGTRKLECSSPPAETFPRSGTGLASSEGGAAAA